MTAYLVQMRFLGEIKEVEVIRVVGVVEVVRDGCKMFMSFHAGQQFQLHYQKK